MTRVWHHDPTYAPALEPPPIADGYNPGPSLAAQHDDIILTVQRTHLHQLTSVYYWQVLVEGRSIPMADGTYSAPNKIPLHRAAADIAWQLYAGPLALSIAHPNRTLTWWNGAVTDHAAAAIHLIYQEALT